MEAINYALGFAVIIAGLVMGIILGRIAKEELKPGRKYLLLFQNILLSAVFVAAVFSFESMLAKIILAAILAYLVIFDYLFNWVLAYASFGFIYFSSLNNINLILISALMFIYGFPTGSLLMAKRMKKR